jgi:hypothetical protein
MLSGVRVEYAHEKKIRARNKIIYRFAHWPIWIWVFFLAPGPLTFSLFAGTAGRTNLMWLTAVLLGTGIAGLFGQLPGVEPKPYILRFCEDKPNPLYRRICYTFAWNALLNFALLNLIGLAIAAVTGAWKLKQVYDVGYLPIFAAVLILGGLGLLPRVRRSTKGEGTERRYFYGAVWAITLAQTTLLLGWKLLPARSHGADVAKLLIYTAVLAIVGGLASIGMLPRTRPILPGEMMVAD